MRLIQDLGRWVRALAHWLVEAWRVWVPALVVALVFIVVSQLPLSLAVPVLRYCGLAFQLLGILTVVSGLRDKRRLFNRPSLLDNVRRWIKRRPRWGVKPQTILVAGTGSISLSLSGKLSVWRGSPPDASVEARLDALEANLATLRTEQAETAKELQEATRKTNEAVDTERRARESAVTALRVQLEGLGAGGLHVEMMGVFWLVLGVVLATVPGEIAVALKWRP
jgi:hypothetical protein